MRGRKDDGRRRLIRAQPQQEEEEEEEEEEERGRRWVEEGLGAPLAWRRSCSHGSLDRPVKVYWFLVTLLADLALRHGANQLLVFGLPGQVYLCCGGREARPRPASREQTGDSMERIVRSCPTSRHGASGCTSLTNLHYMLYLWHSIVDSMAAALFWPVYKALVHGMVPQRTVLHNIHFWNKALQYETVN
ncbi:uncharacterized protein [Lolium perenne]|uniref:uncharacterized protein n=1 Tax=Lolium perenne TaxID=4522 RepID=UPI003A99387D